MKKRRVTYLDEKIGDFITSAPREWKFEELPPDIPIQSFAGLRFRDKLRLGWKLFLHYRAFTCGECNMIFLKHRSRCWGLSDAAMRSMMPLCGACKPEPWRNADFWSPSRHILYRPNADEVRKFLSETTEASTLPKP